jgi:hypothetical protein
MAGCCVMALLLKRPLTASKWHIVASSVGDASQLFVGNLGRSDVGMVEYYLGVEALEYAFSGPSVIRFHDLSLAQKPPAQRLT